MSSTHSTFARSVIVALRISKDEYLKYYARQGINVYATSIHGQSICFPAKILQRYVTHSGIEGTFEIFFDDQGRFQSVTRHQH